MASRTPIEHVTHSICTLEFEDHRPLYDWLIENLPVPSRPRQYEFARLNISYTVLSKRILTKLVSENHVSAGTIRGCRLWRECGGVLPAAAIREFVRRIGVARAYSTVDVAQLDAAIRGGTEPDRAAADGGAAAVEADHRELSGGTDGDVAGDSTIPTTPRRALGRSPSAGDLHRAGRLHGGSPKKFFRLSPGARCGLRYGFFVTCNEICARTNREVMALRCTYDPTTRAAMHLTDAKFRPRCTGSRRQTR